MCYEVKDDDVNDSLLKNTSVIVHVAGFYDLQNSIKSIERSMDLRVNAVEADVRISKDGVVLRLDIKNKK